MPTVVISTPPYLYFSDNDGNPLSGGKIETYLAGTTTPQTTYTDASGTVANANPVVCDSSGRCVIFLDNSVSYKYVVKDSLGSTIRTIDNITPFTVSGSIASGSVTNTMLANMAANTVKVRAASTTGAPSDLAIAASQLVGRGATGDMAAITLGSGLSMSGTTLSASASAGLTQIATSTPTGVATVTFSSIPQTYRGLYLVWNALSGTSTGTLQIDYDYGSGFAAASNVNFKQIEGTVITATNGTTALAASIPSTLAAANTSSGNLRILPYQSVGNNGSKQYEVNYTNNTDATKNGHIDGSIYFNGVSDTGIIGLRISLGLGNFDAGTVTLYGIN